MCARGPSRDPSHVPSHDPSRAHEPIRGRGLICARGPSRDPSHARELIHGRGPNRDPSQGRGPNRDPSQGRGPNRGRETSPHVRGLAHAHGVARRGQDHAPIRPPDVRGQADRAHTVAAVRRAAHRVLPAPRAPPEQSLVCTRIIVDRATAPDRPQSRAGPDRPVSWIGDASQVLANGPSRTADLRPCRRAPAKAPAAAAVAEIEAGPSPTRNDSAVISQPTILCASLSRARAAKHHKRMRESEATLTHSLPPFFLTVPLVFLTVQLVCLKNAYICWRHVASLSIKTPI